MTIAENIAAARDYLDEHGWTQNAFYNAAGEACLRGAVIGALRYEGNRNDIAVMATVKFLGEQVCATMGWERDKDGLIRFTVHGTLHEPVAHYNDRILPDKDAALEFLDKCRITAEEQGK